MLVMGCGVDAPAEPVDRVIYGDNDVVEAIDVDSSAIRDVRGSVGGMVPWSWLDCDDEDVCELATRVPEDFFDHPWCAEEPYADQPVGAVCSGFLVGDDLMVTAGHCLSDRQCSDVAFVFDFGLNSQGTLRTEHLEAFGCADVLYHADNDIEDIALVRLDREASGRPLCIERQGRPEVGTRLASVGHVFGSPKKAVDNATVLAHFGTREFGHNLDWSPGASGAPVLDRQTMRVYGPHTNSEGDWRIHDAARGCNTVRVCSEDRGCDGFVSVAASMQSIEHLIPEVPCYAGQSAHQNPGNKYDVDDNRVLDNRDLNLVRDVLNGFGAGPGMFSLHDTRARPPYLDVDGDGWLSYDDVELVSVRLGHPNVVAGSCGDFDGDGVAIETDDLVAAFQIYYAPAANHPIDGDCDGDRRITSVDWVRALQRGLPYI